MTGEASSSALTVANLLAERFDEEGLPYAFGGALAIGVWGVPRATQDVDVSVFVPIGDAERVISALERAGALMRRDDIARSLDQIGMFTVQARGIRVDLFLAHHPMHDDMERRRVAVDAPGFEGRFFLSPEDVVLTKLIYHRDKDLMDLERLFAIRGDQLDLSYVRSWLVRIAPPEDTRHASLRDLVRRFVTT